MNSDTTNTLVQVYHPTLHSLFSLSIYLFFFKEKEWQTCDTKQIWIIFIASVEYHIEIVIINNSMPKVTFYLL